MASTISWHIEKHTIGQLAGLQNHNDRKGKNHANKRIDPERSQFNQVFLNGRENLTYQERAELIFDEQYTGKRSPRKDAVVDVQSSLQFGGDLFNSVSQEKRNAIMQDATSFIMNKFGGQKNLIAGTMHLDETSDHVHLDMMPITEDGRLSAKDMYSRPTLQTVQRELLEYMQAKHPDMDFKRASEAERGFANGKTQKDFEKLVEAKKEADRAMSAYKEPMIELIAEMDPQGRLTKEEFETQKALYPNHGLTDWNEKAPQLFSGQGKVQIRALFRTPQELMRLFTRVKDKIVSVVKQQRDFIKNNADLFRGMSIFALDNNPEKEKELMKITGSGPATLALHLSQGKSFDNGSINMFSLLPEALKNATKTELEKFKELQEEHPVKHSNPLAEIEAARGKKIGSDTASQNFFNPGLSNNQSRGPRM